MRSGSRLLLGALLALALGVGSTELERTLAEGRSRLHRHRVDSSALLPVTGGIPTTNGGPMAAVIRGKRGKDAEKPPQAKLLRIAPESPFACRGPYVVSQKLGGKKHARIELKSSMSEDLSVSWEVAIASTDGEGWSTRSVHAENPETKEWEVDMRDGNGTALYRYAYRRFNPALGAQRMNVTDAKGTIVAFIQYVSRAELRVFTCMDSASPFVGGVDGPEPVPTASPSPAPPASFLQVARQQPDPSPSPSPSPEAPPIGPAYKGPCSKPRETARLSQQWGDSAAHAWTLEQFERVDGQPAPEASPSPGAAPPRFASLSAASAASRPFLAQQYDVLLLLELAALVSHDEAPWCVAVTAAYVLLGAAAIIVAGIAAAVYLGRSPSRRRRRRKAKRPPSAPASRAGSHSKRR